MRRWINWKLLSHPANRGKHLIFVSGKLFKAKTGREALQILERVQRQYPEKKVSLAYVPKADTLILLVK